jgi:hypothetical protein
MTILEEIELRKRGRTEMTQFNNRQCEAQILSRQAEATRITVPFRRQSLALPRPPRVIS